MKNNEKEKNEKILKNVADLNPNFLYSDDEEELRGLMNDDSNIESGIYQPSLKKASDKRNGYKATIRFLPNIYLDNETNQIVRGQFAIKKHVHYINIEGNELSGYYDCQKDVGKPCPICALYYKLKNSRNVVDNEKAKKINKSEKYYSYVLVIEDDQQPESVGKVLVFPYGFTIKGKILSELNGDAGEKCKVYDLSKGKDFKLIIKEKGDQSTYEFSTFYGNTSPIKIWNEDEKRFITVPVDENGLITNKKAIDAITKMLLSRKVELEEFQPKEWDDETSNKIDTLISYILNDDIDESEDIIKKVKKDNYKPSGDSKGKNINDDITIGDDKFFDDVDEDDDDELAF